MKNFYNEVLSLKILTSSDTIEFHHVQKLVPTRSSFLKHDIYLENFILKNCCYRCFK